MWLSAYIAVSGVTVVMRRCQLLRIHAVTTVISAPNF
jgi:hypothetical protein